MNLKTGSAAGSEFERIKSGAERRATQRPGARDQVFLAFANTALPVAL